MGPHLRSYPIGRKDRIIIMIMIEKDYITINSLKMKGLRKAIGK